MTRPKNQPSPAAIGQCRPRLGSGVLGYVGHDVPAQGFEPCECGLC